MDEDKELGAALAKRFEWGLDLDDAEEPTPAEVERQEFRRFYEEQGVDPAHIEAHFQMYGRPAGAEKRKTCWRDYSYYSIRYSSQPRSRMIASLRSCLSGEDLTRWGKVLS